MIKNDIILILIGRKQNNYRCLIICFVKIHLIPPNKDELKQRLIKRNLDPPMK